MMCRVQEQEKDGTVNFTVITNDGSPQVCIGVCCVSYLPYTSGQNLVWLCGVKQIVGAQLPKMPKE